MSFQDNLRKYREEAGYKTAKDFSKVLSVSYDAYVGYENKGREPKYAVLVEIAQTLGVTTDELLGNEPEKQLLTRYIKELKNLGFDIIQEKDDKIIFNKTAIFTRESFISFVRIVKSLPIYKNDLVAIWETAVQFALSKEIKTRLQAIKNLPTTSSSVKIIIDMLLSEPDPTGLLRQNKLTMEWEMLQGLSIKTYDDPSNKKAVEAILKGLTLND